MEEPGFILMQTPGCTFFKLACFRFVFPPKSTDLALQQSMSTDGIVAGMVSSSQMRQKGGVGPARGGAETRRPSQGKAHGSASEG